MNVLIKHFGVVFDVGQSEVVFLVHPNLERIWVGNQNPLSNIEFLSINKKRPLNVPLNQEPVSWRIDEISNCLEAIEDLDAPSSGEANWL